MTGRGAIATVPLMLLAACSAGPALPELVTAGVPAGISPERVSQLPGGCWLYTAEDGRAVEVTDSTGVPVCTETG